MQPQSRPERPQVPLSAPGLHLGAGMSAGRCKDEELGVGGAGALLNA